MAKYNGPSFITEFKLNPRFYDALKLDNIFEISRVFYNKMLKEALKRFEQMNQSKVYQKNKRCIRGISKKISFLEKKIEKETKKSVLSGLKQQLKIKTDEQKILYQQQTDIMKMFGYQEFILHAVAAELNKYYKRLDSNLVQKLATRAFQAVEKIRKGKAKRVRFKKYGSMTSIEGKTNKSGFIFRKVDDNYVLKIGKITIPVDVKQNDLYGNQAIRDLSMISYCRIVRKLIRGKVNYYVQLTIKGVPPLKKHRKLGKGIVSIDPSLQMMAIVSQYKVMLAELAPKVQNIQEQLTKLQRKLQRSREKTNPKKFNPNGTINRKDKTPWVRSNNYMKLLFKLKELYRKQTVIRKLSHNRLSNLILRMGNIFMIEKNSYKAFQKRKKNTTVKNGRFQSKKRFGKSIASKAPSAFLTTLKNKANYLDGQYVEIDPRHIKPSQYDHVTHSYKKKKLSERQHVFSDGTTVQRDLYSAFLIGNVDLNTGLINQSNCMKNFTHFKQLHDIEIERIKKSNSRISAFGI